MCNFEDAIRSRLSSSTPLLMVYIVICASFGYLGCYFVNSPLFVLPLEEHPPLFGVELRGCFFIAAEGGKLVSRFLGLFIATSIERKHRLLLLVIFNIAAMLLITIPFTFFGSVLQVIGIFLGTSLIATTFGIIMMYIEGRHWTETLSTIISASFFYGTPIAKKTGMIFMEFVDARFVPLLIGFIFLPISLLFLVLLNMIPDPSCSDVNNRSKRSGIPFQDQISLVAKFWPGLLLIMITNFAILLLRNFRDYFAPEVYTFALGEYFTEDVYYLVDLAGGMVAMLAYLFIPKIKSHKMAFYCMNYLMTLGGTIIIGFSTLYAFRLVQGIVWIVSIAIGLWLIYIPINTVTLWDRLFAVTCITGTGSSLVYGMDIAGTFGTIILLIWKFFVYTGKLGDLFLDIVFVVGGTTLVTSLAAVIYFVVKFSKFSDYNVLEQEANLDKYYSSS